MERTGSSGRFEGEKSGKREKGAAAREKKGLRQKERESKRGWNVIERDRFFLGGKEK